MTLLLRIELLKSSKTICPRSKSSLLHQKSYNKTCTFRKKEFHIRILKGKNKLKKRTVRQLKVTQPNTKFFFFFLLVLRISFLVFIYLIVVHFDYRQKKTSVLCRNVNKMRIKAVYSEAGIKSTSPLALFPFKVQRE